MEPRSRTTNRIRGTTPEIEAAARGLRRALTPAERVLWQALRNRQVGGLKFRCQHPVGRFIVDFYCPACKLVIELDGGVHDDRAEIDEARTQVLNNYGYRVLRFRNEDALRNLGSVLEQILQAASVPHSKPWQTASQASICTSLLTDPQTEPQTASFSSPPRIGGPGGDPVSEPGSRNRRRGSGR